MAPEKNYRSQVDKATEDVDFDKQTYQISLETNLGTILCDLYPDVAPGHCLNIIGLTRSGFYDGIIFHRVIKRFMIQVGCPQGRGTGGPGYEIDAEFNSKPHEPGTLSMARTSDPNSAGSQFFLCLERVPHLDRQYTVFGKTANEESLAVVKQIGDLPTDANDRPRQEAKIVKASVVVKPK